MKLWWKFSVLPLFLYGWTSISCCSIVFLKSTYWPMILLPVVLEVSLQFCHSVFQAYYCTTHLLAVTTMTSRMSSEVQLKVTSNHLLALLHHHHCLDSRRILSYFQCAYVPTLKRCFIDGVKWPKMFSLFNKYCYTLPTELSLLKCNVMQIDTLALK